MVGAALLQQQANLPGWPSAQGVVLVLLALAVVLHQRGRLGGKLMPVLMLCLALVAGFYWAAWRADLRLAEELPRAWEGRDIKVIGVVAALPQFTERGVRFTFDVEQVLTPQAQLPSHIQLF